MAGHEPASRTTRASSAASQSTLSDGIPPPSQPTPTEDDPQDENGHADDSENENGDNAKADPTAQTTVKQRKWAEFSQIEEAFRARINSSYRKVLDRVPDTSRNSITVEKRKEIRESVDIMRDSAMQLIGIIARLTQEKCEKEEKIEQLMAEKNAAPPRINRAWNINASSVDNRAIINHEFPPLRSRSERPAINITAQKTYPVRVESKVAGKTAEQTQSVLKQKINPVTANFSVSNIKKSKDGAVIVECSRKEDAEKLKLALTTTASDELRAKDIKKSWPRISISSIESGTNKDELINIIAEQNAWLIEKTGSIDQLKEDMREKFRYGGRGRDQLASVVFEVNPKLRKELISRDIKVGWFSTRAEDYFSLTQCYKCYEYGHRSANCKQAHQSCGKCGGEHAFKSCEATVTCCIVCKRANDAKRGRPVPTDHDTKSDKCQTMQRIKSAIMNNIDYHGD